MMRWRTGAQIAALRGAYEVTDHAFSADGLRVATGDRGNGGGVSLWDATTGRQLAHLTGERPWLSPDGARLVTNEAVWDVSMLTKPMAQLARDACTWFLAPRADRRTFSSIEMQSDRLIRDVWLRDGRTEKTDICAGVAGAAPLVDIPPPPPTARR